MRYGFIKARRNGSLWSQSGISVLELTVASAMSLIALAAAGVGLQAMFHQQPRISEHGQRVQEARVGLERMTRVLRQTYSVNVSSSSYVDVLTYKRVTGGQTAEQRRVVIDCSGTTCTEQEGPVDGALGSAVTFITGVTNADIFNYEPDLVNPSFLRIKLKFDIKENQKDPAGPATLSEGVQLRNIST